MPFVYLGFRAVGGCSTFIAACWTIRRFREGLERLKGQRAERHSIRVNDQDRVTFRWESGHAYEVCVEDYH